MPQVAPYTVPPGTKLAAYGARPGYYTDCFATELDGVVALSDYINAFYTTPLFKAERLVLRLVGIGSSDAQVSDLATGATDKFAAWRVEYREEHELLMDAVGRTWSWFRVEEAGSPDAPATRLLFGSVVAPMEGRDADTPRMGFLFAALLGAHRVYSRLLLAAAARRIARGQTVNRVSDKVVT